MEKAAEDEGEGSVSVKPVCNAPPGIITDRSKAVLSLRFHLFYVRCCSLFKCFKFNTSVSLIYFISKGN